MVIEGLGREDGNIPMHTSTPTSKYVVDEHPLGQPRQLRVIATGSGASALNIARSIDVHMEHVDLVLYEKNHDLGGTWLENTYPGCACDIPSHCYQYSWAPNPKWDKFYSPAPEILKYFQDTAEEHGLRKYIKFKHQIMGATWNEEKGRWDMRIQNLSSGLEFDDWCDFFINSSGYLNNWKYPDIPGLHTFKGELMHSAAWNSDVKLKGKKVAVLGCGSSGIQVVPNIQPEVEHLTTFIRQPTWITAGFAQKYSGPGGTNFDFTEERKTEFVNHPETYHAYRKAIESELNGRFKLILKDSPEQAEAVRFSTEDMKSKLGAKGAAIAEKIIPDFAVACRRPTPGNGYLESLTKDNVRVVQDEIAKIIPEGIVLVTGEVIKVDIFICATGFDLSYCPRFPIIGQNATNLADQWKTRATAYLSVTPANMPNYFLFMGPNSPVGHGSAMPIIEHTSKYILKFLYKAQTENIKSFVPKIRAIKDFTAHSDEFLKRTAWSTHCRSWFKNGTVDGPITALHPGSRIHWFQMMTNPRWEDWEWTSRNSNIFAYLGNGFSTREAAGKDLTWYFDKPDEGYEGLFY
ncbi:putative sterigmatocystin biosynthesis monooxygenase [Lachnellula subtilissima]|uniref:Putative sterigmatocystin biosynthesis monooxygenase n=1 Tax=Lachnellula subtilissima TaxID=602034 RepID=A0A8H8UH37_9HELO|nr:putative sterigmatocystin biosynthesis monooxygenase [Lachnellula subtilissima]